MLGGDAEVGFEGGDLLGGLGLRAGGEGFFEGGDHHVFGGVFAVDELEDIRFVAALFQQQGAEGVGEHLRRALGIGAEAKQAAEGVIV